MKRKFLRILSAAGAGMLALSTVATPLKAVAASDFQTLKGSNMVEYYGDYDAVTYPYENIEAKFTSESIQIDGSLEDAYNAANVSRIDNFKNQDGYGLEAGNQTYGELRTLWDGPVLYLGISVYDDCVMTSENTTKGGVSNPAVAGESVTTYPYASWGGFWATYAVTSTKETCDSVAIAVDLFNDRTTYETDTAGIIVVDALGQGYWYSSSNIPSLGSPLGDPNHPEYMNIIKGYAAAPMLDADGNQIGYNIEVGLQIEGVNPQNGTQIGLDLKINDVNNVVTDYKTEEVPNPNYVAPEPEVEETTESEEEEEKEPEEESEESEDEATEEDSEESEDSEDDVTEEETEKSEEAKEESEEAEESKQQEEDSFTETSNVVVDDADPDEPEKQDEEEAEEESKEEETEEKPESEEPEFIEVKTPVYETKKSANIFWSHNQDSLYTDFDHEHAKSVDWGVVTLVGKEEDDEFAYSEYRITKILDFINSASFQKGVYTEESQKALDEAVLQAQIVINSTVKDKANTIRVAQMLEEAFAGLRWADTRYPDPADLEKQNTLPNTYKFFGTDRVVTNKEEWEERRQEILDLAQFYEYGYKPEYDSLTVKKAEAHKAGDKKYRWSNSQGKYVEDGTYTSSAVSITVTVTVGDRSKDISFDVNMPTDEQIEGSGHAGEKLPIVLSFDGNIASYTNAGIALISVPSVVSDTRTNDYAWNKRTGTFYDLYPYSRNGEEALNEVSNEMASAWAASVVIDALEMIDASEDESINKATADLAVDKLAVTGFSINGKYAFVSAVFDDRIDVCIPGAAGATGPSPWRYVYRGQEYDWTGTDYTNPQVDSEQVAWGTEVMANSIRHNRVRETELFRHFLTPGHFYEFEDGAYGYGTRLPYDQNDLIATLAPRAIVIENTVNDYNDGCTSDCLGAEIAGSVYRNLGLVSSDLIKYNLRSLKTGDPHGSDTAQRDRSAEYLNYFFFGTAMSEATANYLSTDPFSLNISNNQTESPYDYYWGGYNTITGGTGGVNGRDGWYYYSFPVINPSSGQTSQGGSASSSSSGSGESGSSASTTTAAPVAVPIVTVVPNIPVTAPLANPAPAVAAVTEDEVNEEPAEVTEIENGQAALSDSVEEKTETTEETTKIEEKEAALAAAPEVSETNSSLWIWVVIGIIIVGGAVCAYFYFTSTKETK